MFYRILKWVILPLLLVGAVIGGMRFWSYSSVRESTDDAQIDGHIYPVNAMIDGTVREVLVENNQIAEKGAVLGHIDTSYYVAAVEKAQGELREAIAVEKVNRAGVPVVSIATITQLTGAEAGVTEQTSKIATAQRELEMTNSRVASAQARAREAQANASKATSDLERLKPLIAKEEISRQQYDAAVAAAAAFSAAAESATGQVQEVRQAILLAEARLEQEKAHMGEVRAAVEGARTGPQQIAATQAKVESAGALVQQKQAALKQAQIFLAETEVRAPVRGMVSQRTMEPGQTVARGQPLMAIVPLEDVWVTANFKESQLARLRPGQEVTIEVDAFGGKKFKGRVDSVAAATGARFSLLPPENATGNYVKVVQRVPVKIVFEKGQDQEHQLRPGMSVTPTVYLK